MAKVVQEAFGGKIIEAVADFAKSDIPTVDHLVANEFSHVSDPDLQRALAETFYGARWVYKLGLALLVQDVEQLAHVRTQVMDYGAVCEGLLSDALLHGLQNGYLQGRKYRYRDTKNMKLRINWTVKDPLAQLTRQSFHWHIEVAEEEGIVDSALCSRLHSMRLERNAVHLRSRTKKAYIGTSRYLFDTTLQTIDQSKAWREANP